MTHSDGEARVTLTGVQDEPGVAGRIFGVLAEAGVDVDVIIENEPVGDERRADLSFTVDPSELSTATDTIAGSAGSATGCAPTSGSARFRSSAPHAQPPGVAAKVFEVLGGEGINIEIISTSPIKIACVIDADRVPTRSRPSTNFRPRRRSGHGRTHRSQHRPPLVQSRAATG